MQQWDDQPAALKFYHEILAKKSQIEKDIDFVLEHSNQLTGEEHQRYRRILEALLNQRSQFITQLRDCEDYYLSHETIQNLIEEGLQNG